MMLMMLMMMVMMMMMMMVQVKYPVGSSQRTFWEITGQQRWNWKETICSAPNPGTRSVGEIFS